MSVLALDRSCRLCGGTIPDERNHRARFCSKICQIKDNKRRIKERYKKERDAKKLLSLKTCLNCGDPIHHKKRLGAKYCCSACQTDAHFKRYRENNKSKKILYCRRYRERSPEILMISRTKSRAKKAGIPHNIDASDIYIPKTCPVLGIKLEHGKGKPGFYANSPSVDRIEASLGYVKGNVRVISWRANMLKSDASIEELEAVLADLKNIRGESK